MKKKLFAFILFALIISPAIAATTDFTADGDITVSAVTFGVTTADMLIMNGSTAESWTFDSGAFTVTNPGSFKVGSSDASVRAIKVTQGGTNLACAENSSPGTSYVTTPTASGTYTLEPSSTTDCTSLCTALSNVASYNPFPSCGASSCNSGYTLSGSGASATCVSTGGGAIITPAPEPPTTYQTYDPLTGKTTTGTAPETPATPAPTPEPIPTPAPTPALTGEFTIEQMLSEAEIINTADVEQVLSHIDADRNANAENNYNKSLVGQIVAGSNATSKNINKIINFVTYGTQSVEKLGAGERAGVVNSFKMAFNKIPASENDWSDVIKIANGRWPSQTSQAAEDRAKINFKRVYKREPNMKNAHDDAAITVMAYGLRPAKRNMNSEAAAIKSFKAIYGYSPVKATAWDVVRAIAYSGATR